jgi:UV DNA damage endonuclease
MTTNSTPKIGFCCKWIDGPSQINGVKQTDTTKQYNVNTTTVAWLKRQDRSVAEDKMWDLIKHNIEATCKLVEKVGTLDEHLRMVRLGSDILPMYTHNDFKHFYVQRDFKDYAEREFHKVGQVAMDRGVRLSFHPGQFCVLASDNDDVVNRSIEEFEYHANMARWMGYGLRFQDLKINVHISGRKGPQGIKDVLGRLSPEARNCITIENDEMSWGLDSSLELGRDVALVLDVHHHFVRTGEYIKGKDDRCLRVIDSWRGVRPVIHYSQSREDVIEGHNVNELPNLEQLLSQGYKKQKLRAHSNFMWNNAVNDWAREHWEWADVQVEAKAKNLASFQLAEFWKGNKDTVSPILEIEADSTSNS